MKKLINRHEAVVAESLAGMAAAHADFLKAQAEPALVYRADAPIGDKTALISGGGSGHEPLHAGFVGPGMLDAACPGEIFTSPTPDQMLEAARVVDGGAGVLFIVKNYSGDVMNFEMAVEMAAGRGIRVANILIDDDVAVKDSLFTQGRRGVGTTVLAEKICGAAAEKKYPLERIAELCRRVNLNGRSMGMALSSCTLPAKGTPTVALGDTEMEFGIGIHGEPGRERMSMKTADEISEELALCIIEDPRYTRSVREWDSGKQNWIEIELSNEPFQRGDNVLAFVNGMGGTPLIELYIVYRKLADVCLKKGLRIARTLVGSYITSLEMQGCSITLLRLDEEMTELWDEPVKTAALRWGC